MKTIVFGGSGFLGSHIADALQEAGHRVTLFDLKPSPYLQPGQKMVVGDIMDEDGVRRAMAGQDVVYNFAGFADIEAAQLRPLETVRANILGNCLLLEAARRQKIKRYVFASTLYVYSQAGGFYRASKRACEDYIESYRNAYGLPYTILRFGSLYGPRADLRNGIYRLMKQAMEKKKIVYWGTGEEIRDYIHVQDAALCSLDILAKAYEDTCVILTGNQPMRVKDLLTMIREMFQKNVKIVYRPDARRVISDLHYSVSPYSFMPKEGKKLVRSHYVDLGQGLLSIADHIHRESGGPKPE